MGAHPAAAAAAGGRVRPGVRLDGRRGRARHRTLRPACAFVQPDVRRHVITVANAPGPAASGLLAPWPVPTRRLAWVTAWGARLQGRSCARAQAAWPAAQMLAIVRVGVFSAAAAAAFRAVLCASSLLVQQRARTPCGAGATLRPRVPACGMRESDGQGARSGHAAATHVLLGLQPCCNFAYFAALADFYMCT